MVFVVVDRLEKDGWVVLRDVEQFPFHIREEAIVENCTPVLGRQDDVIVAEIDGVCSSSIFTHANSIP